MKKCLHPAWWLPLLGLLAGCVTNDQEFERPFWARMSTAQLLYYEHSQNEVLIDFSLNSRATVALNPEVAKSVLLINDVPVAESHAIFLNREQDEQWTRLEPHCGLFFRRSLTGFFENAGRYRVVWQGPAFESSPLVIDVRPHPRP